MIPLAVGLLVAGGWTPNRKSRLGTEHLMTPILREHALIVGQGKLETSNPIRVSAYGKGLSFRSCVALPVASCEMTVVSLFKER